MPFRLLIAVLVLVHGVNAAAQPVVDCPAGRDGAIRCDWPNGTPRLRGQVGPTGKTGRFTWYDEHGRRLGEVPFVDDLIDGVVHYFWPNGRRRQDQVWRRGVGQGLSHAYHETGALEVEGCTVAASVQRGIARCVGAPPERVEHQLFFFDNGLLEQTYTVQHGKWNGPWHEFFDTGELHESGTFVDDELHGTTVRWSRTGALVQVSHYHHGHAQGTTDVFMPDGRLSRRLDYDHDQAVHAWEYDSIGLYREHTWDGHKMRRVTYDSATSRIREESWSNSADLHGPMLEGSLRRWDAQGLLILDVQYRNGKRNGPSRSFYPNGKLAIEEQYRDNDRISYRAFSPEGDVVYGAAPHRAIGE